MYNKAFAIVQPSRDRSLSKAAYTITILRGKARSDLLTGTINNQINNVPAVLLVPVSLTADNVTKTVIADGFRTQNKVLCQRV